jgi:hypothetical protein
MKVWLAALALLVVVVTSVVFPSSVEGQCY